MIKKILKWGGIAVGIFVAGVLALAMTKPDELRVQRSITINAPQPVVFELVNDYRNWGAWSPWEKKDPAMKRSYSGPPSGKGALITKVIQVFCNMDKMIGEEFEKGLAAMKAEAEKKAAAKQAKA